jgi:pimeloyl-ACP methyl ester carboxylesterase
MIRRMHPSLVLVGLLAAASMLVRGASAQNAPTNNPSGGPLVLVSQGSFFVGGRTVNSDANSGVVQTGVSNEGDFTVDQMYVQYMVPSGGEQQTPVVMVHGCCLSAKEYETTPDGRMGWQEYFVRKGYPVYLPDQASRARSGFDPTVINEVKLGMRPPTDLPGILAVSHQRAWELFRLGPQYGTTFSDSQFPVGAVDDLYRQLIPDLNSMSTVTSTLADLSQLALQLHGAVLVGHSESGFFPERATLVNPAGIKGVISVETGAPMCDTTLSPDQVGVLAKIPILLIWGDHLSDVPSTAPFWSNSFQKCNQFAAEVNAVGGNVQVMSLPDMGIHGNSHMLMQDMNNLQIADLVLSGGFQKYRARYQAAAGRLGSG